MKKTKLVIMMALVLASLMLLSSCAAAPVTLKDLLDLESEFEETDVYKSGDAIDSLKDVEYQRGHGKLVYFTSIDDDPDLDSYKKHIIYNMDTDEVLKEFSEGATRRVSVSLGESYFVVETTTYDMDITDIFETDPDITVETVIYDADGDKVADAEDENVLEVLDLIYFDGKCYRFDDESIEYVFDYSELAAFPKLTEKSDNYYYEISETDGAGYVKVYDLELNFVSKFYLPDYAMVVSCFTLENGNIFVQYTYPEHDLSDQYTFVLEAPLFNLPDDPESSALSSIFSGLELMKKYTMVSGIVNANDGSFSTVETDYAIFFADNIDDEYNYGVDYNGADSVGAAYKIQNKRLAIGEDSLRSVTVTTDGQIAELPILNGSIIEDMYRISEERWVVSTTDNVYLIDNEGTVIGEITNADRFGDYIYGAGKVYDLDLEIVYDYKRNDMTVHTVLENSIIFEDEDGELLIYDGSGTPDTLVEYESDFSFYYSGYDFFVILDESDDEEDKYNFYNSNGKKILTIKNKKDPELLYGFDFDLRELEISEDAVLLSASTVDGDVIYYRLNK